MISIFRQLLAAILCTALVVPTLCTHANGTTTLHGYDNVRNLTGFSYSNGVSHSYSYDTRNRLTSLVAAKGAANLAGYSYLLDATYQVITTVPMGAFYECVPE
jgi:YD repeat-containing protein